MDLAARMTALLLLVMCVGSCSKGCNILSGSQPAHCEAATGAGLILAAPILIPAAVIDEAKANRVPDKPVEQYIPRTPRERELYRAAGAPVRK